MNVRFGRIGLGTAPLGGLFDPVDEEAALATVTRAWELGVRFFDTAPLYGSGLAEERTGAVLCTLPRERVRGFDEGGAPTPRGCA